VLTGADIESKTRDHLLKTWVFGRSGAERSLSNRSRKVGAGVRRVSGQKKRI
jgi:hypothetical protein